MSKADGMPNREVRLGEMDYSRQGDPAREIELKKAVSLC
jgi:hypothetical protein